MARSVLITGAGGYLGGRLVMMLAADPAVSLVGTTRGTPDAPRGWPGACRLIHLDALNENETALADKLHGTDTVIHLASPNEIASAEGPAEALLATGVASLKLLRAAQRADCRRFIYLSTIHVYGSPLQGRITETDLPKPVNPYAIAHRTAEDFVLAAHAKCDIEGLVLRLSNGIGAPAWPNIDRWNLIGNALCRQAVNERRISLHSSGLQWRDFVLLRDFVAAIRHATELAPDALGDGLFNLGGRLPLRMIDVAEIVARRAKAMLGQNIPIECAPGEAGENWLPIDYCIDRFAATGYMPSPPDAIDAEIDATLALCRATAKP
jgi:UDP-glucose 4-epimerase